MAASLQREQSLSAATWPLPLVIAWIIWRGNRTWFSGIAGCLAVLFLLAHTALSGILAPLNSLADSPASSDPDIGTTGYLLSTIAFSLVVCSLMTCGMIITLSAYQKLESDPTVSPKPYPAYLLRAPVHSVGLAVWPILYGVLFVTSFWVVSYEAILHPMGLTCPVLWPALLLALASVSIAAVMWSPFSLGLNILVVVFFVVPLWLSLIVYGHPLGRLFYPLSAAAGICMIFCAVAGLTRVRRGDLYGLISTKNQFRFSELIKIPSRVLRSPVEAERKVQWVRFGSIFPCAILVFAGLISPLALIRTTYPIGSTVNYLDGVGGRITLWASVMELFLILIPVCAACVTLQQRDSPYMLTRPLTTLDLVAVRIRSAFAGASLVILISLVLLCLWFASPVFDGTTHVPVGVFLFSRGVLKATGPALFCFLIWSLWIYRLILDGSSVGFSGRTSLSIWSNMTELITMFVVAGVFLPGDTRGELISKGWLPIALYVLAALKTAVGIVVLSATVRRRLIERALLVRWALLWTAAVACLFGASVVLLPKDTFPPAFLLAGIILTMPLVRLSLGPLLLDRNRHR